MTRKDFELIAAALRATKPDAHHSDGQQTSTWVAVVEEFAERLVATNPRFDVGTFYTACGHREE